MAKVFSWTCFVWNVLISLSLLCIAVLGASEGLTSSNAATETEQVLQTTDSTKEYGVDVSWTMHYHFLRRNRVIPSRTRDYNGYISRCYVYYTKHLCARNEKERIKMNLNQPRDQTNFTATGYAKVMAPDRVARILRQFWDNNEKLEGRKREEKWEAGSVYTNHWDVATQVVPIDGLYGLRPIERQMIMNQVQGVVESWSGVQVIPSSLYGIRVYQNNSILAPHVDRLPHVLSAVINVAQDTEEDWPLEVIDHSGKAVNITLKEGEMVLYESLSVIHGRPFPLRGKFYANVFVQFEPLGYTADLHQRTARKSARDLFEEALVHEGNVDSKAKAIRAERRSRRLPSYVPRDSQEANRWRQNFVYYRDSSKSSDETETTKGVTSAHLAAARGNLQNLKDIIDKDPEAATKSDSNGWKPIHEAARSGHANIVEYLIKQGSDPNERTNDGKGATPLWWAQQVLEPGHEVIQLLQEHGAQAVGPHD